MAMCNVSHYLHIYKESQDESEVAVDDSQPVCECEVELEEERCD